MSESGGPFSMAPHSENLLDVESMPKDYIATFTGTSEFCTVQWRKISSSSMVDKMFLKTRMRVPVGCSDVKKHLEDKLPSNSTFERFLAEVRRTDPTAEPDADSTSGRTSKRARRQTLFMGPTESNLHAQACSDTRRRSMDRDERELRQAERDAHAAEDTPPAPPTTATSSSAAATAAEDATLSGRTRPRPPGPTTLGRRRHRSSDTAVDEDEDEDLDEDVDTPLSPLTSTVGQLGWGHMRLFRSTLDGILRPRTLALL